MFFGVTIQQHYIRVRDFAPATSSAAPPTTTSLETRPLFYMIEEVTRVVYLASKVGVPDGSVQITEIGFR